MANFEFYVSIKGSKQGQFPAESTKVTRKEKWIEHHALSMESLVPYDIKSMLTKGEVNFSPILLTKERGAATPALLQAEWSNETLSEVVIEIVGRDPQGVKEIVEERITLTNARIVSSKRFHSASASEAKQTDIGVEETWGYVFEKVMVENVVGKTSTSYSVNAPDRG